jgi:hypothetical protein
MEQSAPLIKSGRLKCEFGRVKEDATTIANIIGTDEANISARLYTEQRIEFDQFELIGYGTFREVYKLNDNLPVKRLHPVSLNEAKRVLHELKNWSEISAKDDFFFLRTIFPSDKWNAIREIQWSPFTSDHRDHPNP